MSLRPTNVSKDYDVAIFDFDGTLVDTALVYPLIHKEVLRELGVSESELEYLTVGFWLDNVNTNKWHIDAPAYLIERHGLDEVTNALDFRKLRQRVEMEYLSGERDISELASFPEYANKPVMDDLKRLHASGARCFVVSHNYGIIVKAALSSLGVEQMFDDCFCHCAYDEMRHPRYDRNQAKMESFAEILAEVECDPANAVVYDDLMQYVEDAISLGMDAVLVDNEHGRPPLGV